MVIENGKPVNDSGSQQEGADEARFQLLELVKRLGLFDYDLAPEPARLERLKEIFDQLPDEQVIGLARRMQSEQIPDEINIGQFIQEYNISDVEGRLLESLISGLTVVEHAEKCLVSVNTSRSQMRHLLDKTETKGQLDLIRKFYGRRKQIK